MPIKQRDALAFVGQVEEAMVGKFPYEVPADYADRPLLKVGQPQGASFGAGPA